MPQKLSISFAENEPFEQKTDIKTALPHIMGKAMQRGEKDILYH